VATFGRVHDTATWLAGNAAAGLLAVTVSGLAADGGLYLAGQRDAASQAWLIVTACGLAYAVWTVADSLRRRSYHLTLLVA
jgi:hypothetical protein